MRRRIALVLFLLAVSFSAVAQKRAITEKDLFQFQWIGDPQLSPDGSRIAYVLVTVNEKKTGYDTAIWSIPTSGNQEPIRLTHGKHDGQPRWSPDGKNLAFVRAVEGESGKPQPPQINVLPMSGGEAYAITKLPKGAMQPVWSPDSKSIAFGSSTTPEDLAKEKKQKEEPKPEAKKPEKGKEAPKAESKPESEDERESDVRVITRAIYREDNEGYLDPKDHGHIWVVNLAPNSGEMPTPRQLTTGNFDEEDVMWSRDGSHIYFTSEHVDEPYYELPHTDLYSIPSQGGDVTKITTLDLATGSFALSPDGKRVAFLGQTTQPVHSYTQPDLFVMDLTPGAKPRNLTADYDYDVGDGGFGDSRAPRSPGQSRPVWSQDGSTILERSAKEGRTNLISVDVASGKVTDLSHGDQTVQIFRSSEDGSKIVTLISTPVSIGDLFVMGKDGTQHQLTHVNDKLFSQLNLTQPEEIWYTSFDGKKVQAWIQKPPDFDPKKKYPLILNIHGGPHGAYGWVFDHEFQWMAAKGYVVLYPNPRGSTSYGQEFGNIIQYHYPGDDYKDLMAGVDEVIKRGYIDTKKLGVTGGSGGGLLTNWTVTQTQRFAAAVSQRDIASWANWWYTADFTLFQPNWFHAPPFDDPQDYVNRSPITYIKNVTTPMMFILGEADYRTPPGAGGEQMFRALKFLKRPTVMVRFPGESHELSRSGQPWHRVERLEHIVGWFDKYLQGKKMPQYDVVAEKEVPAPAEQKKPESEKPPEKKQ